jgi:DNA-binding transcriptional ArsR family regulator
MNGGLSEGTRRLGASPFEPLGRFLDGHSGLTEARGRRTALAAPARGRRPVSKPAGAESGLTRRGVIYEYVREHPGAHVRGMARDLGLATGDLHYHLFWLERNGFVKTMKNGFYRFVFPTMVFREDQEVLLGVLSQETPREILLLLLQGMVTQGGLAKGLGHSQPTVSWHMDRLTRLGVVSKRRTSDGTVYEVAADRDDVLRFVRSYYPRTWKRWAGRLGSLVARAGVEQVATGGPLHAARTMPPVVVEMIGKR